MSVSYFQSLSALMAVVMTCGGCTSTQPYVDISKAGTTYAATMDKLLVAALKVKTEYVSEQLLKSRQDKIKNHQSSKTPVSQESLKESYEIVAPDNLEYAQKIGLLRRHVCLLSSYFANLGQLAGTDAPDRIAKSMGDDKSGLAGQMVLVGSKLKSLAPLSSAAASNAAPLAGTTVRIFLHHELYSTVQRHASLIRHELALQRESLSSVIGSMKHDFNELQKLRMDRVVVAPYADSAAQLNGDDWNSKRWSLIEMDSVVEGLDATADCMDKLLTAWEDLVAGKSSMESLSSALAGFDRLTSITDQISPASTSTQSSKS